MKTPRLISLALLLAALGAPGFAAQPDEHSGHHPAGSAGPAASKTEAAANSADIRKMDSQTDAMKAMHEKMMAAKTPEERSALMNEHMKTMGAGMAMMKDMPMGMGKGDMKGPRGMADRQAMMEKRMSMMEATMEMMGDRLPQPAK